MKRKVTRREFVRLSVVLSAGMVSAACAKPAPTEAPPPTQPPVKATEVPTPVPTPVPEVPKEAPMLAELVKQGKLPPLQDRLPKNPWVAPVAESVGKFGGTIRRAFNGVSDRWGPTKLGDRGLGWFDRNLVMQPRILESWEINEDASVWTLHLRPGMKWSDGTPFTADDFVWTYENEWTNKDINPAPPSLYTIGKPPVMMTVEKVDDYTIKYKFAHPNPLFIYKVSRGGIMSGPGGTPTPSAYMKQFHINFAEDKDALQAAAQQAGFNSWSEYYIDRNNWYMNPDRPSVMPWLAKNKLSEELFVMERNPYFFAVDPEGKQLPYVDKVTHRLFESAEVLNLWVTNGEIDFQARHMAMANYTLYKENEEKGDYKVFLGKSASHLAMNINHTTKNKRLREFFQDRRVRIAMNLAINREEINELIYDGLLTPRQYSPVSMSPQYYPKASNAYIEYDPDKANQLLDEAGYTEKDAEGFRKWKDGSGEIISFTFEGTAQAGTPDADAAEMVSKYLADVGIKATYKYLERSLYTEHYEANEIEAAWWGGDRTVVPLAPAAVIFRGTQLDRPWACAWGRWFNDPSHPAAEEPPADHWIRKIWDLWAQIEVEPNPDKQNELFFKILDIWAEEVPMIGVLGESPAVIIVKNGFRNYLNGMPLDDPTGDEHLLNTETYFWEEPEKHV